MKWQSVEWHFLTGWLAQAYSQAEELVASLKKGPPVREEELSERLPRIIQAVEEARQELAEASALYYEKMGIPRSWSRHPLLTENILRNLVWGQTLLMMLSFWVFYRLYQRWHDASVLERFGIVLVEPGILQVSLTSLLWGIGLVVIALVVTILLHEGLHGAAVLLIGGRPQFVRLGGWEIFGVAFGDRVLRRNEFAILLLAPLIVISAAGILLMQIYSIAHFAFVALVINSMASIGDLWMLWCILKAGPKAVVTAWGIYAPPTAKGDRKE